MSRRPCNYNLIFHPILTRMSPSHHSSDSLPPPPPSLPSRPIVPMPPFRLGQTSRRPQRKSGVTPLPWSQTTSRSPYLRPTTPTRRLSLHAPVPLHSPFTPTIISPRCPPFYFPFQLLPWSPFLTGAATTRRVYPFLTDACLHLSMFHAPPKYHCSTPCSATAMENVSVHTSNPQQRLLVQRSSLSFVSNSLS